MANRPIQNVLFMPANAFKVPEAVLPFTLDVQFAAGEGLADGSPDFTGAHPVRYFSAGNPSLTFDASARLKHLPARTRSKPIPATGKPARIDRK